MKSLMFKERLFSVIRYMLPIYIFDVPKYIYQQKVKVIGDSIVNCMWEQSRDTSSKHTDSPYSIYKMPFQYVSYEFFSFYCIWETNSYQRAPDNTTTPGTAPPSLVKSLSRSWCPNMQRVSMCCFGLPRLWRRHEFMEHRCQDFL